MLNRIPIVVLLTCLTVAGVIASGDQAQAQHPLKVLKEYGPNSEVTYAPEDPCTRSKIFKIHTKHTGLFYNCDGEEQKRLSPHIKWKTVSGRSFPPFLDDIRHPKKDLAEIRQRIRDGNCSPKSQPSIRVIEPVTEPNLDHCFECADGGCGCAECEHEVPVATAKAKEPEEKRKAFFTKERFQHGPGCWCNYCRRQERSLIKKSQDRLIERIDSTLHKDWPMPPKPPEPKKGLFGFTKKTTPSSRFAEAGKANVVQRRSPAVTSPAPVERVAVRAKGIVPIEKDAVR